MKKNPITLYKKLKGKFGDQYWWPVDEKYHKKNNSDPRFEIIIGTLLTQNTSWSNVEKAINNLKLNSIIDIELISTINIKNLQNIIKPSGFFNQKASRIKKIAIHINKNYNNDLDSFFNREIKDIREELLSLNGIGLETADSILLYAGKKPIFVVDQYTKNICKRLPLNTNISYDEIQKYFQKELSKEYSENEIIQVYNELHALIVILGKNYCKKNPRCIKCPLEKHCKFRKNLFN